VSDGGQQLPGVADVAARFVTARLSGDHLKAYPGPVPVSLTTAYAIQDAAIDLWPDDVAGWKSGLVQPQHRAAFGDAERIAGPIFRDQVQRAVGDSVIDLPVFAGGFAAVEAEFVFRVGVDAPAERTAWSVADAAALVGDLFVGIESAGSPFPGINDLGPAVTASDFGNNAGLVLGARIENWRDIASTALTVETFIDGKSVGRGDASMIPGGTLAALAFIAGNAAARGRPLRAGQYISTGAVTGVHAIASGQTATADFGAYGQIRCRTVKAGSAPQDQRSERSKQL
jgi:2-keto-4-pentenoate hydratase